MIQVIAQRIDFFWRQVNVFQVPYEYAVIRKIVRYVASGQCRLRWNYAGERGQPPTLFRVKAWQLLHNLKVDELLHTAKILAFCHGNALYIFIL